MSFYFKRLNSVFGEWIEKFIGEQKVWVSSIADMSTISDEDVEVEKKELVSIINERFDPSRQRELFSAIYGDSDFLPISFLEKGAECADSVCRLLRCYGCTSEPLNYVGNQPSYEQDEVLKELIKSLKQADQRRKDSQLPSFTHNYLAEILDIEAKLGPEAKRDFFRGFESTPLDALTVEKLRPLMPIPVGSGFLVGENFLMTNHHVLGKVEEAKEFIAQFRYEKDLLGEMMPPIEYALDDGFFVTSPKLDYTIAKLKRNPDQEEAGKNFGYLRMIKNDKTISPPLTINEAEELGITGNLKEEIRDRLKQEPILKNQTPGLPGEPVNIIQHPKGQLKQIVLSSNRMMKITHNYLRYEADANFSSSGSPVLNQQWQLVGLHHAALADEQLNIIGQEGIRMCRIVEDLEEKQRLLSNANRKVEEAVLVAEDLTIRWDIIKATIEASIDGQLQMIHGSQEAVVFHPIISEAIKVAFGCRRDEMPTKLNDIKKCGLDNIGYNLRSVEQHLKKAEYNHFSMASSDGKIEQLINDLKQLRVGIQSPSSNTDEDRDGYKELCTALNQLGSEISKCAQELSEFCKGFVA